VLTALFADAACSEAVAHPIATGDVRGASIPTTP